MRYIKPHLSPELRAQITPHKRRDMKLTIAGVFFLSISALLVINLWPKHENNQTAFSPNNSIAVNPDQKQILGATTQTTPQTEPIPQFTQYTVKTGDTLFNISQQYNIRWDSIAQLNNLTEPYVLHAGLILKIPQATTSKIADKVYTIKTGESLTSIAKQFNVTIDDIIAVNPNLQKSELITVGQIIKLP